MFKRAAKEADPALVAAQKEVRPRDPWTTTWLQHAHCLACDSATRTLSCGYGPVYHHAWHALVAGSRQC